MTPAEWEAIARSDLVERAQLFATTAGTGDEVIIGSGIFVRCGADHAEVAFVVEEDYQGQGLACLLLHELTAVARRSGIARFEADVLPENSAMLSVFTRCGWPLERRLADGIVHLTLSLPASPTDQARNRTPQG